MAIAAVRVQFPLRVPGSPYHKGFFYFSLPSNFPVQSFPYLYHMKATISKHIAEAIRQAEVEIITYVPGFGANQVAEEMNSEKPGSVLLSYHEEVAFSISMGAAITGARSVALLKTHGIAKAANAIVDALSCGLNAGFVLMVFDDKTGAHSDNIFDAESMIRGLRIPNMKVGEEMLFEKIKEAMMQSEAMQLPFLLLFDADDVEKESMLKRGSISKFQGEYIRDLKRHLVVPPLAAYQWEVLEQKLQGRNWREIPPPKLPEIEDIPDQWQDTLHLYSGFYDVFKDYRGSIVCGDTGIPTLFAFDPYACVDICAHMGGSIPLATGAMLAGHKNVWAITGDFSFIAAGHLGLPEVLNRKLPLNVVIFNNRKAETTGGQQNHEGLLERLLLAYQEFVTYLDDPGDTQETKEALERASSDNQLNILVLNYYS